MPEWTTAELPEHDQFSYWREVICEEYVSLNTVRPSSGSFVGTVKAHLLSTINVTTISSPRHQVLRGRSEIAKMPAEVYFLNLQVRGQSLMSQGTRSTVLRPGEFALVDATEPYLVDHFCDGWQQHSFRIPHQLLRSSLRNPQQSTCIGVACSGGIESATADFLTSIATNAKALSPAAATLSSSLIDLVALSLGATANAAEKGRGAARKALCSSLVQHIEKNAADPGLSPAKVAKHFRVSVRYLHKSLEASGQSFGRILLEKRLDRCARELCMTPSVSISEVAFHWGFNDVSHFSRVFRQRFGKPPREYRHEEVSRRFA